MAGRARRLLRLVPIYARTAWWGLVAPRVSEAVPLVVHQAVVLDAGRLLLSLRSDLQGWELPGGNAEPGERGEDALRREVREETGVEVAVERHVGDYVRSGFRPHTARVYRCHALRGTPRASRETPRVRWFDLDEIPAALLPWYRVPLADALAPDAPPVERHEHWGLATILAAIRIDLRMRLFG